MLMPYFWYMALNITRLEDYSKWVFELL